jgi:hypothetical protein
VGIYSPVALAAVIVATALDKLTGGLLSRLAGDAPPQADKSAPGDHSSSPRPVDQSVAARSAASAPTARKDSASPRLERSAATAVAHTLDDDEPVEPSTPGMR